MTDPATNDLAELEADILENASAYSFRQLVRLLRGRLTTATEQGNGTSPARWPRMRPELSLELPRFEVARVERYEERYEIVTTFLGLYGVSSPLPAFYTEELIEAAQEDRTTAQTLLDVIHQHLFELYVEGREKYQALDATVERGDRRFRDTLRSLVGLRDPQVRRTLPDPDRMLRYLSLLGPQQRSAAGLRTLLADALGSIEVDIAECVERRVRIPLASRVLLGQQSHALGQNTVIGMRVNDRLGRFRIRIGPMSEDQFHALVNRHNHWNWLVGLIRFYLHTPLQCELELVLEEGAGGTTVLGDPALSQLGTTTWLFSGRPDGLHATLQLG